MNWRLVRVMRRKGSENRYFVQRIPSDVKARAVGMTLALPVGDVVVSLKIKEATSAIRVSLKTASAAEAKARQAVLAAHVERVWQSLRSDVRKLTLKEAVSLAGELYRRFTAALEDNPGTPDIWEKVREANRAALAGNLGVGGLMIGDPARARRRSLEDRFGSLADLALSWKAIRIDPASRVLLVEQIARAMDEADEKLLRNASGDYRADSNVDRFPKWEEREKSPPKQLGGDGTISAILEGWSKEASAAGKASLTTLESYSRSVRKLIAFLGHDEAHKITPENVVEFKDARLAEINPRTGKPVSAKTVNDSDLSALKTVFGWGLRNRRLTSNPAAGITIAVADKVRTRSKSRSGKLLSRGNRM